MSQGCPSGERGKVGNHDHVSGFLSEVFAANCLSDRRGRLPESGSEHAFFIKLKKMLRGGGRCKNKEGDKWLSDRIPEFDPQHCQRKNIIKKLKGSDGIPLKPRVGLRSHSQQGLRLRGRCVWHTPLQKRVITSRCCSGSLCLKFHPAANVLLVVNYSVEYKLLLCHLVNLVFQNNSLRMWSGSLIEEAKG